MVEGRGKITGDHQALCLDEEDRFRPVKGGQLSYPVDPAAYCLLSKVDRPPRRQSIRHERHSTAEDIDLALRRRIKGCLA
ncbi:hypothetical protein [Micromonospora sp. NBC_00617]|uniref:hypothetical protein n=1 Tax=Micromonospora sp. NBC_00617 TaxID=2903587 RepID=UPI0030DF63DA